MRLIDADALNETLRGILREFVKHPYFLRSDIEEGIDRGVGAAMQAIDDASTVDAVPVVRCKDCRYWQDNNEGYPHPDCRWGHEETPDPDDYCSYGERRGGND